MISNISALFSSSTSASSQTQSSQGSDAFSQMLSQLLESKKNHHATSLLDSGSQATPSSSGDSDSDSTGLDITV